jgi:hypothetical protein
MQKRQANAVRSIRAVRDFLDSHSAKFPHIATTGARKKLDDAIVELSGHVKDQSGSTLQARGETENTRTLRAELVRHHMRPISRIALGELPNTPQVAPLRVQRTNVGVEKLVAAAHGMARAAEPYTGIFTAAGLPLDFIEQLRVAADALLASVDRRSENYVKATTATDALGTKIGKARTTVKILDAFVRKALTSEPELLAGWDRIKRVRVVGVISESTPAPATNLSTSTPAEKEPAVASAAT